MRATRTSQRSALGLAAFVTSLSLIGCSGGSVQGDTVGADRPRESQKSDAPASVDEAVGAQQAGIAVRFLAFARGESDDLPVDTPVRLYLGSRYRKTITPTELTDRSSWNMCAAYYAERSCPMSALTELRSLRHDPAMTSAVPTSCLDSRTPTGTGGSGFVVLTTSGRVGCMETVAVQIWTNDVAQITAVNLLLGSP